MGVSARLALAAIVATGLAFPASAAAVTLYASSAPSAIHGPPPWTTTYTLELDAGPADERVVVTASGELEHVGGTAKLVSDMEGVVDVLPAPGCAPLLQWKLDVYFHSITLELQAGTAGFLTMSRTRSVFPAGTEDLGYTFNVRSLAPDGTVSNPLVASLAGPAIMLPRRPSLSLTSRDVPRFGALLEKRLLRIRGHADRALSGQLVDLRYTRNADGQGSAKLIAHVRVRRDGSFAYRWLVPGHGRYSVSARYRSQDSRFVSARSECLLGFNRA